MRDRPYDKIGHLPNWCCERREEALCQASRMSLALDFCEHGFTRVLDQQADGLSEQALGDAKLTAAATLYQALMPVHARLSVLLKEVAHHFNDDSLVTGELQLHFVPSPEEAQVYAKRLEVLLGDELRLVEDRQAERKAKLMVGAGRRPETTAKKAARKAAKK